MRSTYCVLALIAFANLAAAQAPVPDALQAHDVVDPDALERLQACSRLAGPQVLEEWRKRAWQRPMRPVEALLERGASRAAVEQGGVFVCLPLAAGGLPLLPVDTILQAVRPLGADPATEAQYARRVSQSLATTGFARGLMLMDNGNAYVVSYAVSADRPWELAYDEVLRKPGEYQRADYPIQIEGRSIRGISASSTGSSKRVDVLTRRYPTRPVADGYLVRPGNAATGAFAFAGTTWATTHYPRNTYELRPDGTLIQRARGSSSFGGWRVRDDVLTFDTRGSAWYSALLDGSGHLVVEARDAKNVNYRFRLFRLGDEAAEKQVVETQERLSRDFLAVLDRERQRLLAEPPPQGGIRMPQGRDETAKPVRNTLCPEGFSLMARAVADYQGISVGELCNTWIGSREEWKRTILREGCQGRCSNL